MTDILSDIRAFLAGERELFGDALLVDTDLPGDSIMARPKSERPKPEDEPALFELPPPPTPPITDEPWGGSQTLSALDGLICTCMKCPLGRTRTNFVFGTGNPAATLMIIGEAPGADEDAQGEPFVGRAGQLLNKILEAIHFKREEVYIGNILKCRPPNNREPQADEIDQCEPHLWKQLELLKPKIIVCLGRVAGQTLLRTTASLGELRGKVHSYRGIKLVVTYHPAALLRNPNWKKPTWEDVQWIRKMYDEMKATSASSPE